MATIDCTPRPSEESYSSFIDSYNTRATVSSSASLKSMTSTKSAVYSHPLYPSQYEKYNGIVITVEESHFSSCSTSPSSSCESLDVYATPQQRRYSAASSEPVSPRTLTTSLAAVASNRTSRSSCASSRFADDHYPLISKLESSKSLHTSVLSLVQAHNAYIRAINSCYNHAFLVDDDEVSDFLFFSQTLYNIISQYLKQDRHYLQPLLHRPASYSGSSAKDIHQDHTFQQSFLAWGTYIHSSSRHCAYCPDEMQSLISRFAPTFVQYLHDEIADLNCMVSCGVLLGSHFTSICTKFEDALSGSLDMYTDIALLVGCHDRTFAINGQKSEGTFPKVPFRTSLMVKKWHSRKHEGAWKFCSSNFSGKRRVLSS